MAAACKRAKVTLGVPRASQHCAGPGRAARHCTALELLGDFSYLYAAYEGSDDALILRVPDSLDPPHGSVLSWRPIRPAVCSVPTARPCRAWLPA
jgi:hypothetical protein